MIRYQLNTTEKNRIRFICFPCKWMTALAHHILCTVKKIPVPFPAPSRDVTYQTLSSREYIFLMKPGVFPTWKFHRILLKKLVFLIAGRSFPGYSSSPAGNFLFIFLITRLCTCFQPGVFPDSPSPGRDFH